MPESIQSLLQKAKNQLEISMRLCVESHNIEM